MHSVYDPMRFYLTLRPFQSNKTWWWWLQQLIFYESLFPCANKRRNLCYCKRQLTLLYIRLGKLIDYKNLPLGTFITFRNHLRFELHMEDAQRLRCCGDSSCFNSGGAYNVLNLLCILYICSSCLNKLSGNLVLFLAAN